MKDIDQVQLLDVETYDECGSQWKMGIDEAWDCSNPNCDSQFFYYGCQFCGKESCVEACINRINVKDSDSEELRYCDE